MRRALDALYTLSGALAGFFIVAITCVILAQIIARWVGFIIPSTDDLSGFFLAASSFLGLAYTFTQGGHIRVSLVIQQLPTRWRKPQEILVLLIACILGCVMTWHLTYMVYESWLFEDVSIGYLPIPLWIPQSSVALGMIIFNISLIDALIGLLRGQQAHYQRHEEALSLEEL